MINSNISASEVMLIGEDGKKTGILSIEDALEQASKSSLDLVQVSPPNVEPIVCKLLDYGKLVFSKKKSNSSSKSENILYDSM